ncbi:MAG: pyrimidine 5'-nucleotidase [Pseudomonadota bacterium]
MSSAPAEGGFGHVDTWVFDLDNTLYHARHGLFDQVDVRITNYVARLLEIPHDEARRLQKAYFQSHGTTLNGLVALHECDPEDYLAYVHDIDYTIIPEDPTLDAALDGLPGRKLIFTNGDVPHAERVTERLGIAHHFEGIFDIVASDYIPKPEHVVYESMVSRHAIAPRSAAMFEDIARNLAPAKALGMTTVWVRGESAWASDGHRDGHIDHITEDLTPWLVDLSAALARS